jgi:hypothetical protein
MRKRSIAAGSAIPWKDLLEINPNSLLSDEENLGDNVEKIGNALATMNISLDDPETTPDRLMHLLKLSQVAMQVTLHTLYEVEDQLDRKEVAYLNRRRSIT